MLDHWKQGVLGSSLTTIQVGGAIDYFSSPTDVEGIRNDFIEANAMGIPVRVIGGGSNIVFDSKGFRGLVIRPNIMTQSVRDFVMTEVERGEIQNRYATGSGGASYLKLEGEVRGLGEYGEIVFGSGVAWGAAVMASLQAGFIGLHTFAHIPCRIGGAVVNNIHGGPSFLSEYIVSVDVYDQRTQKVATLRHDELAFDYDASIFHHDRNLTILSAVFRLEKGTPEQVQAAKTQYLDWVANKKTVQPSAPSCGSVFQNLELHEKSGYPSRSAGYYLERVEALGLTKGAFQVATTHANFITNLGGGSSDDFIALVRELREKVYQKYGFYLTPEVEIISDVGDSMLW